MEIPRQVMKEFTCPTKAWIFYSKQSFEHVSDDQSVLHKLLWLRLWLHGWDKIKTTKFGDSGVLKVPNWKESLN